MKPIGEGNHMPDNGPPEHWEWPEDNSGQYCKNNAYSSGNCDAEGHVCKWYLRWFRLLFVRGSLSFNLIFLFTSPPWQPAGEPGRGACFWSSVFVSPLHWVVHFLDWSFAEPNRYVHSRSQGVNYRGHLHVLKYSLFIIIIHSESKQIALLSQRGRAMLRVCH